MKILRVNFRDGIYLNGQVKQAIGLVDEGESAPAMSLMGLTRVDKITPGASGLLIEQGGRTFFTPWASVSSCEVLTESIKVEKNPNSDLLGDEPNEENTRPATMGGTGALPKGVKVTTR
jgi:hypothetical protein